LTPEKPAPKAAVKPSKAFVKKKREEEPPLAAIAQPDVLSLSIILLSESYLSTG